MHPHPGDQLVEREGLCQVIARTTVERGDLGLDAVPRRQHEHSRRLWILLRGGEHGEAVGHREQQVEHDQIPAVRREQLDRLSSVARDDRVESLGLESVSEEPRDQGLVFDDQDVHLRTIISLACAPAKRTT